MSSYAFLNMQVFEFDLLEILTDVHVLAYIY